MRFYFTAVVLFLNLFLTPAWALTVEEAYKAIPHRQTVFNSGQAKMSTDETAFLVKLFQLTDEAVVERVGMVLWLTSEGKRGRKSVRYDSILKKMADLNTPEHLFEVKEMIMDAVKQQRFLFEHWEKKYGFQSWDYHKDPRVIMASQELRQAYSLLMRIYPKEDAHNKQAFFDYLCALDFI